LFDRHYIDVERSEREGISSDSAPQIYDPSDSGAAKSIGVLRCDSEPSRLFQPSFGKEHSLGKGTQLRRGAASES